MALSVVAYRCHYSDAAYNMLLLLRDESFVQGVPGAESVTHRCPVVFVRHRNSLPAGGHTQRIVEFWRHSCG